MTDIKDWLKKSGIPLTMKWYHNGEYRTYHIRTVPTAKMTKGTYFNEALINYKHVAVRIAAENRKKGHLARVVPIGGAFAVYIHKKEGK